MAIPAWLKQLGATYLISKKSDGSLNQTDDGRDFGLVSSVDSPWEEWAGSGINANTPMNLGRNAIGFDGNRLMHEYTKHNNTWIVNPSGLTKDTFLGG